MKKSLLVVGCFAAASWTGLAHAAEFVMQPVRATGTHSVVGTEIRLTGGGQTVIMEIKIKNYAPSALKTYQSQLNSAGYSSGSSGVLAPAAITCPSVNATGHTFCRTAYGEPAGVGSPTCADMDPGPGVNLQCTKAWINVQREDFVFFGLTVQAAATDTSTLNYRWGATLGAGDLAFDGGSVYYSGSVAIDVPANAAGTFTIGFIPGQGITFLANENNDEINPLLVTPGRITVLCTDSAQCNDNNFCTDDTCDAQGSCVNSPNYNVSTQCCDRNDPNLPTRLETISDGNACTDDSCNTTTGDVTHANSSSGFACGNPANAQCDLSDTCDGAGQCQSNILPSGSPCGSTIHTDCNFADTCNGAGICLANLQPTGTPCGSATTGPCDAADSCNGAGTCLVNTLPNNTPCDDSLFCTDNTRCTGGVCGSGSPHNCADSLTCTTDTCNETTDLCENTLDAGRCLIASACYVDGNLEPGNTCAECDSAVSTSGWTSLADGSLCNDGNACTGTGRVGIGFDTCTTGVCAGVVDPQCNDQCEFAVPAVVGQNVSTNATAGDDAGTASCQIDTHSDIWFTYTADCDGVVFVSTTGSNLLPVNDPVLNIFSECVLNGGVELACDDDSGAALNSALVFNTIQGEDYFIRVSGFGSNKGDIMLNLRPAGDCLIDGVCYLAGERNPENDCQACIPEISSTEWSSMAEGTACGDPGDTECDSPDACDGLGVCEVNYKTDGIECPDDGAQCTKNLCLAGLCTHPPEVLGLPCGSPTDTECDNPDSCDGGGLCDPNFEGPGFSCGNQSTTQCDKPDACNGNGVCMPRYAPTGVLCNDGDICTTLDACLTGLCVGNAIPIAPDVEAISSRHIRVTPQPNGNDVAPVALRVTSPNWPCLLQWVDDNGALVPIGSRVFKTAADWGTILVHDPDIVPSSTYDVVAECGTFESAPGSDATYLWGDLNNDGIVDFADIAYLVQAFRGTFISPLETYDLYPCVPNGQIDFSDIAWVVSAFQGRPYPCTLPCHD